MYKVKMKLTAEEMGLVNWLLEMVDILEPINKKNNELAKSIKTKMKVKVTGDDKEIY